MPRRSTRPCAPSRAHTPPVHGPPFHPRPTECSPLRGSSAQRRSRSAREISRTAPPPIRTPSSQRRLQRWASAHATLKDCWRAPLKATSSVLLRLPELFVVLFLERLDV